MELKPSIMGIVNVTPDSFSDGGQFFDSDSAVKQSVELIRQGADIVDIGAESTRPNAVPVDKDTEWSRLSPVLARLAELGLSNKVSVDTRNAETALRAAEDYQVAWINNVAGLFDRATLQRLAKHKNLRYVAMHMHGMPQTMQETPLSRDAAPKAVSDKFVQFENTLYECGFTREQVFLDPGIGFGKDDEANLRLVANIARWSRKSNILVGVSRKSFIGRLLNISNPLDRDPSSKVFEFALALLGAKVIRTHNVAALVPFFNSLSAEASHV